MTPETLEAAIARVGSPLKLLRDAQVRPYTFPVAPEFTNWRSEQAAWRETCVLFDQSHHMTELYVSGPDALALFARLGVNSFKTFDPGRAKQFVAVSDKGYLIGDAILFRLEEDLFELVGHPMVLDWVQFHLESGGYDAHAERNDNSLTRTDGPPKVYRYELQGPAAPSILERLVGVPVPEVPFFHMTELTISGRRVRALRHGMAGQPGFELFGPWADGDAILEAICTAGEPDELVRAGAKAYSTANLESGWVPSPLPAIFTGASLSDYRAWLPAEAAGSLAGSMRSEDITDYYVTPYDLGYEKVVAFDHEFVGCDALHAMAAEPRRTKVTLVWRREDVMEITGSLLSDGAHAKYIDMPKARYALYQADEVLRDGASVGIAMDCGYVYNERAMVSLATIDRSCAAPGTAVEILWGEAPNSAKPQVEPHRQVTVRATVAPAPLVQFARGPYRWASVKELAR